MHHPAPHTRKRAAFAALFASAAALAAQTADDPVKLSQFVVSDQGNRGYQASNAVSGTRISAELRNLPQNIQVVTSELIFDTGALKTEDVLKQVAAVSPAGNLDDSASVMRGFGANLLVDGVPYLSGHTSDDLSFYDRIEFVKGPAPLLYGSASPGGAINFISKTPRWSRETTTRFSTGSWSFLRGEIDTSQPFSLGGIKASARLSLALEDSETFRGELKERSALHGSVSFRLAPATLLTIGGSSYNSRFDRGPSANAPVDPTRSFLLPVDRTYNPEPDNAFHVGRAAGAFTQFTHRFNETFSVRNAARYSKRYRDFQTVFGIAEATAGTGLIQVSDTYLRNEAWNVTVQTDLSANWQIGRTDLTFVAGHEYTFDNEFDYSANDPVARARMPAYAFRGGFRPPIAPMNPPSTYVRQRERLTMAESNALFLFGQAKFFNDRFNVSGGLRKQFLENDNANRVTRTRAVTKDDYLAPQVAAMFNVIPELGLYANFGHSVVPNLEFPGQPQEADGYEVGFKFDLFARKVSGSFGAFDITRTNIPRTVTSLPTRPVVLSGKEGSQGFDTDIYVFPLPGWQLKLGYAYIDAVVLSNVQSPIQEGTRVSSAPKHAASLWSRYDLQGATLKNFSVLTGMNYRDKIHPFSDAATFRVLAPSYTTWDLGLLYRGRWNNVNYNARLMVGNVTDENYRYQQNMFGEPRNWRFSIETKF